MPSKNVQVIDRAFDILEILSSHKNGFGVTEIGNRLALHKSTVHRIIATMVERGYIERDPDGSSYRLGLKVVELGSIYLNNLELKTEARPFLYEMTSKFSQVSHLAILDNIDAVYIDKVDVVSNIRLYSQIGRRIPVHCSALGKALFSCLDDAEIISRLSGYRYTKFTKNTISGYSNYLRHLNQVRIMGYAIDDEEHEEGIRCVAAPVYDYRNACIAAISVSGPSGIISSETDMATGEFVKWISHKISMRMGFIGRKIV